MVPHLYSTPPTFVKLFSTGKKVEGLHCHMLKKIWYVKVTLQRRLTYSFFFRSIKSLIYHIFAYKVLTPYFCLKGLEIWSFILTLSSYSFLRNAPKINFDFIIIFRCGV